MISSSSGYCLKMTDNLSIAQNQVEN